MLLVVVGVSVVVFSYSMDYLSGDPHGVKVAGYLMSFSFMMLVLVTAESSP